MQNNTDKKEFNKAMCLTCLLDWPMAQCLLCKFHNPEKEVEFDNKTMEMYTMQKFPVTVQEMDRIAKTIGFTTGYNDSAMKRTCLLVRLGCEPTAELYQHELSISERHPADVAQEIESRIDAELFLHAAQEPTQPIFTNDPNCTHEKAYAIIGGMMCKCGAKFQPRNEFEQRMVNARSPRSSGYVNWQFR